MREWVRLYTASWCHAKTFGLSLEAYGLWAMGLAYTGTQEREGFVPAEFVTRVTRYGRGRNAALHEQLVAAGLWEPIEGGWAMHNYDERQSDETNRKEANRIRQQRFRDARMAARNAPVTPVTRDAALRPTEKRREEKNERREESLTTPNGVADVVGDSVAGVQSLVGSWVDACHEFGATPDSRMTPRVGQEVKRLRQEGHADATLQLGLRELARRNEPPSRLAYIVGDVERVQAGTPLGRVRPASITENPVDARIRRIRSEGNGHVG